MLSAGSHPVAYCHKGKQDDAHQAEMQPIENFLIFHFNLLVGFVWNQGFELPIVSEQVRKHIHRVPFFFQGYLDLLNVIQRDNHREYQRKLEQTHGISFLMSDIDGGYRTSISLLSAGAKLYVI